MLTRFVRIQLIVFTIASIVGILIMTFVYMQVPTLLGVGRLNVTLELPAAGGLYRFSNVTYRGVEVGKVAQIRVVRHGAQPSVEADLSLDRQFPIPADVVAQVRSVSAIGELYVDLQPNSTAGPYLHDGSVIPADHTKLPTPVGPMLDKVSALVDSLPKQRMSDLLDETSKAFTGASDDVASLSDSFSTIAKGLNSVADPTGALVDDARPLLDSQADHQDSIRTWIHSLSGVTDQLRADDPQFRRLLNGLPPMASEVTQLLDDSRATLPVLLANLTTIGQVAVVYHPSLETLLVVLPPLVAMTQASAGTNNPSGITLGDFRLGAGDPPACTVGFLPPSQWRNPEDVTTIDTPDGLYCKLPQDSPILVRGARNMPCMGVPGKRAPTVKECYSDKPFSPLAMRQHALGPAPIDPNLIAQGIPVDGRITMDQHLYGPLDGTPLPPGVAPTPIPGVPAAPPPPGGDAPPPGTPAPQPTQDVPDSAPSGFSPGTRQSQPSVSFTQYDPRTGRYVAPSGQVYQQSDLVSGSPKSWQDLVYSEAPR
ncbi:MCE family protein [Mycolicibacterium vinylchloridicum]|uniref:MCE family protein n=1 Tax=Mycolicibacterium vinylchloridicum TaxID=2736928 RepID=UPI0015CD7060|nr:MlaD family protein [Mycolicibacterium vinylchloridicum]